MSTTDPKNPKSKRGRPADRLVVHPDDVQNVMDRLRGPKLKAQPEPGEKPESRPEPKRKRKS